jgi:hypothetical protein
VDKQDQKVSAPSDEPRSPERPSRHDGLSENPVTYEEAAKYNWWVVHYALRIAAPKREIVDIDKLPLLRIDGVRPMAAMRSPAPVRESSLSEPLPIQDRTVDNLSEPVLSW